MDLQFYLNVLKRRAFMIAIVTVVTLLVVSLVGLVMPSVYTARTTVRVLLDLGVADFRLWEDYNRRLLNTYATVLESTPVLEEALARLAPRTDEITVADFRDAVMVEVLPDTELISIAVENGSAALARDMANTLSELLIEYAQNVYMGSGKSTLEIVNEQLVGLENELTDDRQRLETLLAAGEVGVEVEVLKNQIQYKEDSYDLLLDRYEMARLNDALRANSISVVAPATLPLEPSNGLKLTQIGLSLVVGISAGVGLSLVMENLDTSIRSPQQLEHLTDLPVLGVVPSGLLQSVSTENGGVGGNPMAEAYRLLGVNLPALKEIVAVRTILITSAVPKEGKSTVATNLAKILAERGQRIFLVESDMRRPSLFRILGIEEEERTAPGLSTLLVENPELSWESFDGIMRSTDEPDLFVVGGGGPKVPNPTALLSSPFMEEFLGYLGTQGYMTLLNAPPVLGMADVSVLAPKAEVVIMVVREGYSKREQVLAALRQLKASHSHVVGFVFVQHGGDKTWGYD